MLVPRLWVPLLVPLIVEVILLRPPTALLAATTLAGTVHPTLVPPPVATPPVHCHDLRERARERRRIGHLAKKPELSPVPPPHTRQMNWKP
jgi:hypothetical protein